MSTNYLLQAKGLELDDIITLTARSDQSFISKQIIARDNGTYDVGFIITEREKILELLSAQPTEDGAKKVLTTRPVIKKTKKGKDKQETLPVVRLGNVFSTEPIVNEAFSCLVIGRVTWIENSVYGNWVPDGQESSDVRFSTNDAEKAVIKITLDIGVEQTRLIRYIEDAVNASDKFLPNKEANAAFKNNSMLRDTAITIVSSIFKSVKDWQTDHEDDEIPSVDPDKDTLGWIKELEGTFVYCPNDFCTFYQVTADAVEPMPHTELSRDDCVQANIRFAPYAFLTSKSNGVSGIKIIMEDVVCVRKLRQVSMCSFFSSYTLEYSLLIFIH